MRPSFQVRVAGLERFSVEFTSRCRVQAASDERQDGANSRVARCVHRRNGSLRSALVLAGKHIGHRVAGFIPRCRVQAASDGRQDSANSRGARCIYRRNGSLRCALFNETIFPAGRNTAGKISVELMSVKAAFLSAFSQANTPATVWSNLRLL